MAGVRIRVAILVAALACTCLLAATGTGSGIEQQFQNIRDGFRKHPASGAIHIVEVDARSLAELSSWPWPRRQYAHALERLNAAGADTVAFDIDLSAKSKEADDAQLAQALRSFSGMVIIPTFRQSSSLDSAHKLENLPLPEFRERAFLASVNVRPDPDGVIRSYGYGERTDGAPRPSIAALLAGVNGSINRAFAIDQSIDPATIARSSFIDLVRGRVPADRLRGRKILIGATAIELGDRYPTTMHGIQPGVVVQAMAAETLLEKGTVDSLGYVPMLLVSLLAAIFIVTRRDRNTRQISAIIATAAVFITPAVVEFLGWGSLAIVPSLTLLALLSIALTVLDILMTLARARSTDLETGLPRGQAFAQGLRNDTQLIVVAHINNFDQIDTLVTPDQRRTLLKKLIDRLAYASQSEPLARWDAASFAWSTNRSLDDVVETLDSAASILRQPIVTAERKLLPTITFGLARLIPGEGAKALAQAAHAAGKAAKDGLIWSLHSEALGAQNDHVQTVLGDIDRALQQGEIWVAYQPKLDIPSNQIIGAEALVRWRHPERGPIPPDQFITVLEEARRIDELTLRVADIVLADMRQWRRAGLHSRIAINVSAILLSNEAFVRALHQRLSLDADLASDLTVEVTESAEIADEAAAIVAMDSLVAHGVKVSIDDYGTGQSTLSYLKRFPASEIKVDQSFIKNLVTSRSDQLLVQSTVELAHSLGFTVVAEGIEDAQVAAIVQSLGCDVGQGWHIGKPMPADEITQLLAVKETIGHRACSV